MELTKDQLVTTLDASIYGWEFKDIERASAGGSKLGAFILVACFIDSMAGFYAGVTKEESKHGSGRRFKEFVTKYLPQYEAVKLYEDLRCGLVHAFATGESYSFTDAKPWLHRKTLGGRDVLNLENLIGEVQAAYCRLRSDIVEDDEAFKRAKARFESMGLMGPVAVLSPS